MLRLNLIRLLAILGLFASIGRLEAVPTTNGLYAVFNTSKGTIYCVLRYDLTPRTVANFVSLADGTKDWLDYSKLTVVKRRFYDGLIFHRVIKDFVIQAGSANGIGSDDPGYRVRDELVASLTFNKSGILAMANAGPNTDGSQFFITVGPQPALNYGYTIFGEVVEGLDVVTNINHVPLANEKPVTPVTITNVTILRIGSAATAFDATAVTPALPVPRIKNSLMRKIGSDILMTWVPVSGNEYRFAFSPDMKTWRSLPLGQYSGRYMNDFQSAYPQQFFFVIEHKLE